MDIAPDFHPIENTTSSPTPEAVNPTHPHNNHGVKHFQTANKEIQSVTFPAPISSEETTGSTPSHDSQSENEVGDPRPITTDEINMHSEYPTGDAQDTPTPDEPQSYPIYQIAENLTGDPITKETCLPIFSAITLNTKRCFSPLWIFRNLPYTPSSTQVL